MKTLQTERLILRPFTEHDIEIHNVVFSDPDVCRYYCGKTRTREETREWLVHRKWQARYDEDLGFLAVVRKADDQILGLVALQLSVSPWLRFEEDLDSPFHPLTIELSYAIGRAYQRQGYATEACRALIIYGFKEMRLPRLTNGVSGENIPTNRLCQKLGFRQVKNLHPVDPGLVWILDNTMSETL
jgi:RimJ/RimL family protein N-acetyltransferase